MRYLSLVLTTLIFFGCAQLPDPKACHNVMQQIAPEKIEGQSRVYVLKPQRTFMQKLGLLSDNLTSLASTDKYEIFYGNMDNKIGDMREARIVYFDVPNGTHTLFVANSNQAEDKSLTAESEIMLVLNGEPQYIIMQDERTTASTITGRLHPQRYLPVNRKEFNEALQNSCDTLNIMKYQKLVVNSL